MGVRILVVEVLLRLFKQCRQRTFVVSFHLEVCEEGVHRISHDHSLFSFEDVVGLLLKFAACYPSIVVHRTKRFYLSPFAVVIKALQYRDIKTRLTAAS